MRVKFLGSVWSAREELARPGTDLYRKIARRDLRDFCDPEVALYPEFTVYINRRLRAALSAFAVLTISPFVYGKVAAPVCEVLKRYPHIESGRLSFETGVISPLCTPYIRQRSRIELDRCGDAQRDPYSSSTSSNSHFTWASRSEMTRRGKSNLLADAEMKTALPLVYKRIDEIRARATNLCCAGDARCEQGMAKVEVKFCQPNTDPNAPDPCVFGGNYKMTGGAYSAVFKQLEVRNQNLPVSDEIRQIAARNLRSVASVASAASATSTENAELSSGSIVLSSYVPKDQGFTALEPTLLHEFGHACSMVKMQQAAVHDQTPKAVRAVRWLDRARQRCRADLELPDAYYDFWESVGESRKLAQCLYNLTKDNQKNLIDQTCPNLCPGHFLEESVGVAFSLLLGNLDGVGGAVFPQTCDHVRDGQHPMVSDVLECLTQNSPRFRERLSAQNHCNE